MSSVAMHYDENLSHISETGTSAAPYRQGNNYLEVTEE